MCPRQALRLVEKRKESIVEGQIRTLSENREVSEMEERMSDCEVDYDRRILARKIFKGEISEENMKKYLAELPDLSTCSEEMVIE